MNNEWMIPRSGDWTPAVARREIAPGPSALQSLTRPRLAVFDMDGTLLDPMGDLRPQVRAAVAAVRDSGTEVLLATGRSPWGVTALARALDLTGPQLTMNGAAYADPISGEVAWARSLSAELVLEGIAFARETGARPLANFIDGHAIESAPDGSVPAGMADFARSARLRLVRWLEEVAEDAPVRLYIPTGRERHAAVAAAARQRFAGRASIVWGDENGIEVLAPDTNKGCGVRTVAESMGLTRDEVAAVGDAPNDLELLAWAGHSAVMGNAPADVRAAARFVVPSSAEDGVVAAIRRWFPDLDLDDEPAGVLGESAA